MFFKDKFSSENFLLSILGHLLIVSFLLVSISFTVKKSKIISKDRIEITEINLSNIQISKETELYDIKSEEQKEEKITNKKEEKKTIIKVNRQSVTRTMTISVLDALRTSLTRCWVIDLEKFDLSNIRIVAHLKMDKNKYISDIWFESESLSNTDSAFAYALETVKSALKTCQPFSILPSSEYDTWKSIVLNFYPLSGKIL